MAAIKQRLVACRLFLYTPHVRFVAIMVEAVEGDELILHNFLMFYYLLQHPVCEDRVFLPCECCPRWIRQLVKFGIKVGSIPTTGARVY